MKAYLISGPTGAGKNATAEAMAERLDRCAIIDFDAVRAMFTKPHRTPWDGAEGRLQNDLTARIVCHIAREMMGDGRTPIILDVLDEGSAALYRSELPGLEIVHLMPTWEVVLERNRVRAEAEGRHRLTPEELRSVYEGQRAFTGFDRQIDNGEAAPEQVAEAILPWILGRLPRIRRP